MRILGESPETDVVAAFLRGEMESERWGERLRSMLAADGVERRVLARPDTSDAEQNAYRLDLLDRHRGWVRREGLFDGFPQRIDWFRAALSPDEVLAIRYINWDWWLEVSGGTRLAPTAAEQIRSGRIEGANAEWHEPIAGRLRSDRPPPELIAISPPDLRTLVLVEGHVRLTAFALYPEYLPHELEIFLGVAERAADWSEF